MKLRWNMYAVQFCTMKIIHLCVTKVYKYFILDCEVMRFASEETACAFVYL